MSKILAIRRNLAPGAVFYSQLGSRVYYSLDRVHWELMFELPEMPRSKYSPTTNTTVTQILQSVENTTSVSVTLQGVRAGDKFLSVGQVRRNLCAASLAVALLFAAVIEAYREEQVDSMLGAGAGLWGLGSILLGLVALIPAAALAPATGGLSVGAWAGIFAGGLGGLSLLTSWEQQQDNVGPVEAELIEAIACRIYDVMGGTPNAGRTVMKSALYGADAPITGEIAQLFEELITNQPSVYATWLTMLTEAASDACVCGGCQQLEVGSAVQTNALLVHGDRLITRRDRSSYAPSNFKYLSATYSVPLCQVDTLRAEFVTSGYTVQSGLAWGSNWIVGLSISGPYNQSSTWTVGALPPAGAQFFEADFSGVTLAHGVDTISVAHRVVYASSGWATHDPLQDTSLIRLEYCTRTG